MVSNVVQVILKVLRREVSRTDLLGDTTCLTSLDFCFSKLIKNQCFSCIYVTHDTNDRASEFARLTALLIAFLPASSWDCLWSATCQDAIQCVPSYFHGLLLLGLLDWLLLLLLFLSNLLFVLFLARRYFHRSNRCLRVLGWHCVECIVESIIVFPVIHSNFEALGLFFFHLLLLSFSVFLSFVLLLRLLFFLLRLLLNLLILSSCSFFLLVFLILVRDFLLLPIV